MPRRGIRLRKPEPRPVLNNNPSTNDAKPVARVRVVQVPSSQPTHPRRALTRTGTVPVVKGQPRPSPRGSIRAINNNKSIVVRSPVLKQFPERVIIITDKNFANVCGKLQQAFQSNGIDTVYLHSKVHRNNSPEAVSAFRGDHTKMLVLYYDPGTVRGDTTKFTTGLNAPPDIPWGLIRGSSFYRVYNLSDGPMSGPTIIKKHGRMCKVVGKSSHKPARRSAVVNHAMMKDMNIYFDNLTPLIMCGTEDLLAINSKSVYLGQPQRFLPYMTDKPCTSVGHVTAGVWDNDHKKGTGTVNKAFSGLNGLDTMTIGNPAVKHADVMAFLKNTSISVLTMTDWDYGMGYIGLESLASSCLCMMARSKMAGMIKSPLVNVRTAKELVRMVRYYQSNPDAYEKLRLEQYRWGREHYTPRAVANRFRLILQTIIDDGWAGKVRPGLRKF